MTNSHTELRIITPMPSDTFNASQELSALGRNAHTRTIREICDDLLEHARNDAHRTVLLDWAAELRSREGLTWHEALEAASIAYFG